MSDSSPVLVVFGLDLRLDDHPALLAAVQTKKPVIPVYIHAPDGEKEWAPGGASRWWLHHSLQALSGVLKAKGSRLILRQGNWIGEIQKLIHETKACSIFCHTRYEPAWQKIQKDLKAHLPRGVEMQMLSSFLLFEPSTIRNQSGSPYRVFTPFAAACRRKEVPLPRSAPSKILSPARFPASVPLEQLDLHPRHPWTAGLEAAWHPGEAAAQKRLALFLKHRLAAYAAARDTFAEDGASGLSPALHFGEVSPRRVWHAASRGKGSEAFSRQLLWRDFAWHLLVHFPQTPVRNLRPEFDHFAWVQDRKAMRRWQKGKTGIPLVDAGMRHLWKTGSMPNRVRMIVASYLVKDLLIPWQEGARWFWDTLVDADLGNNTFGWQWAAGSGADAAPYFRIFNPVKQGEKWDPQGTYVRRWIPALSRLPDKWIHQPWQAPVAVLKQAGISSLPKQYALPYVDPTLARRRALQAYQAMRQKAARR